MSAKSENKSLFLYTALIFFAAIIIIVVAFFGQANLERSQPAISPEQTQAPADAGITQKAAQLSEHNAMLVTQNNTLTKDIEKLGARNAELEINYSNGNILCTVYQLIHDKKTDEAMAELAKINVDSLTEDQKIIYNNLTEILD